MRRAYILADCRKPAKDVGSKWIFVFAFVFLAALPGQRCPFMESRFPDGPVGAGSTQGSFPGEPLVAMPLSLALSPNADRIISESCYCFVGEVAGEVTSRDGQTVCLCFKKR